MYQSFQSFCYSNDVHLSCQLFSSGIQAALQFIQQKSGYFADIQFVVFWINFAESWQLAQIGLRLMSLNQETVAQFLLSDFKPFSEVYSKLSWGKLQSAGDIIQLHQAF
ncbi:hypothetical protein CEXT_97941 [Caerostris extrusa]|uniref:Uncharacterized protein n=1 Tax=Caerostris extrusa TaxID=172846 RepID=A0AAV4V9H2_CAEEX|nr:hypothetical protein CEXT_97941 [Caerostris extrusa]